MSITVSEYQNVHNRTTILLGEGDTLPSHWWDWDFFKKGPVGLEVYKGCRTSDRYKCAL